MSRRHVIVAVCLGLALTCAGLLFSAVGRVREAAARMSCACNFCQFGVAFHSYAATNGELLPAGTVPNTDLPPDRRLSWYVPILPFIEQDAVFKQFDLTRGPDDPRNSKAADNRFRGLVCPSSGEYGGEGRWKSPAPLTHYVGVAGVGADAAELPVGHPRAGVFGHGRRTSVKDGFIDGTSNTLAVIETGLNPGHWAFGGSATVRAFDRDPPYIGPGLSFGGFHSGVPVVFGVREHIANVGFVDGHYRGLTNKIDPAVLESLATVSGREELPPNW